MRRTLLLGLVSFAFACAVNAQSLAKESLLKQKMLQTSVSANKSEKFLAGKQMMFKDNNLKLTTTMQSLASKAASSALAVSPKQVAPKALESAVEYYWYQPAMGSQVMALGNDSLAVWNQNDAFKSDIYNCAILVPSTFANTEMDSVRIVFNDVKNYKKVVVWVHGCTVSGGYIDLPPTDPSKADYSFEVPASEILGPTSDGSLQYSKIKLPKTFTIPQYGCFVGYYIEGSSGDMPIITSSAASSGGNLYLLGGQQWADAAQYFGNLTTGVHLDVTNGVDDDVEAGWIEEASALVGDTENLLTGIVYNGGAKEVSNLGYILTVNGKSEAEKTLSLESAISPNSLAVVYFPYTPVEAGELPVTFTITKVNGKDNQSQWAKSEQGYLLALEKSCDRKMLVEELTGTWCGWCPRGAVGLENIKRDLGDKVVTLAVHADDPMYVAAYDSLLSDASFPTAYISRVTDMDPYTGLDQNGSYAYGATDIIKVVDNVIPAEASLKLEAKWANDAMTTITAKTTTTFGITRMSPNYAIGYVLSEDGLTGTTEDWLQVNYYAQEFIDKYEAYYGKTCPSAYYNAPDMQEAHEQGLYYLPINGYQHVAVGAWMPTYGMSNTVPSVVLEGDNNEQEKTLNITTNKIIQNKDNLSLTALLINRNNGLVVTCDQVKLINPTSVSTIAGGDKNATEVARYGLNGQRVNGQMKGLNLIKMSDGSVKKVNIR